MDIQFQVFSSAKVVNFNAAYVESKWDSVNSIQLKNAELKRVYLD